jgi:hypothetical protein
VNVVYILLERAGRHVGMQDAGSLAAKMWDVTTMGIAGLFPVAVVQLRWHTCHKLFQC